MTTVKCRKLRNDADVPKYETKGAAGADLTWREDELSRVLKPGERALFKTGLQIELSLGYEAQVRPRSGLALKKGITVLNTPGTIDADYRGEIGVILYNSSDEAVEIASGDRIAQLVVAPVVQADFVPTDELSKTARGKGGFGSTGLGITKAEAEDVSWG